MKLLVRSIRVDLLLLAAFAVSALHGCVENKQTNPSEPKIFGGEAVKPGEWTGVVALASPTPEDQEQFQIYCTATLIHPQLLVTAAHCVDDQRDVRVVLGNGYEGGVVTAKSLASIEVESQVRHPDYLRFTSGQADFGFLKLAAPLDAVKPVPLANSPIPTNPNHPLTLIGFGKRESKASGVKFQVQVQPSKFMGHEWLVGGSGKDSCAGDSGGPAVTYGRLIGIVSRGAFPGTQGCGLGGLIGLLPLHACWLQSHSGVDLGVDCSDSPKSTLALLNQLSPAELRSPKLDLSNRRLKNIEPLAPFKHLTHINLEHNDIEDLSPLLELTNLVEVKVAGNKLEKIPRIRGVKIRGTRWQRPNFRKTTFLQHCESPKSPASKATVDALFWSAQTDDCQEANDRLLSLTALRLEKRDLINLEPLKDFWRLESLELAGNPIKNLAPLSALENLRYLDIRQTQVEKAQLHPLSDLQELEIRTDFSN
jgi:Leucine-rich repeat (LRR) protein